MGGEGQPPSKHIRVRAHPASETKDAARRHALETARILVAFDNEFRAYRDMITAAIRVLRPRRWVETADVDALPEEIERLDPDLVVCSRRNTVHQGSRPAWVEVPIDRTDPETACVAGRCLDQDNHTVEALLRSVDEVEEQLSVPEGGDLPLDKRKGRSHQRWVFVQMCPPPH